MNQKSTLKKIGVVLAAAVVILALIVMLTFVINGPAHMLTSKEIALEQTRISLHILIKQTEVARTSTAELYLTLGVPFPTETPLIVPTSGSLGKPFGTLNPANNADGRVAEGGLGQPAQTGLPLSDSVLPQSTQPPFTATATGHPAQNRTATATPAPSANPLAGWNGKWTVYFGADWEELTIGEVNVTVSGTRLNAVGDFSHGHMTISGEISADGQQVTGDYSFNGVSAPFFWQLYGPGQFGGNMAGSRQFCGSKGNLPKPEACGIYFEQ